MTATNSVIQAHRRTDQGNYVVTFSWASWDPEHQTWIETQGEPEVNLGGVIAYDPNGATEGNENFTLADCFVKLRSGFPNTQTFLASASPWSNTPAKLTAYVTQILANITHELQDMKAAASTQIDVTTTTNIDLT